MLDPLSTPRQFKGKWQMRKTMRALCDLFNVKYTWVDYDAPKARAFLERYGWQSCGEDARGWLYERK